ncbi:ribonuclease T2 [Methylocystis sp. WRRC1]|uniref:ribonuclease T2 n=1 Tax=Methylocystis sp. WRRC1 TaxID=1732014 RepID=UPI001D14038D|nr:ribonuclease T2 [Methylocystis sp. WRRC1]MCC3244086.1 ribonuclease T2 [Methylocystis sp. WRRC1]
MSAVAVFLAALGNAAVARDDCILDNCADQRPPVEQARPQGERSGGGEFRSGAPSRDFDFYVLALSWSPGFCEYVEGARDQCEPGKGLGFVVHGLWPQYERGFPSDCAGPRSPSRIALERANGVFPDERLARYEWRKHGTCSGKSPSDYFADVARAREAVTIPPLFVKPKQAQTFTPIDIERAFYDANPRLRPGMMAVACRRGVFEEVRICLSKDLREFRACPEVVQRGCHNREISVPAPM